jgi:CTP-dependent riboflavin kinase
VDRNIGTRGGHRIGISPDGLHWELWTRSDTSGFVDVNQADLATELHCTKRAVLRVMQELEDAGRVLRTSRRGRYEVNDPARFVTADELT